ncbi:MAG: hypothetical protein V4531_12195 [Actinomycetota bacterium]
MSDVFFDEGDDPLRDPFATAFLARLRNRAEAWTMDVRPIDTGVETMPDPVAARVFVPGLSGTVTALWVLCQHPPERPPVLHGSWGDRTYVGDDHGRDPLRDLTVSGVPSTAEELADLAARWFELHLRTDIYRDEWNRGPWSRRDAYGTVPPFRKGARTLTRSVLERSAGTATGEQLI